MAIAYLSLGSNEGDRQALLRAALAEIGHTCGQLVRCSSLYETAPWGVADQPYFLNIAAAITTTLPPGELLECLKQVEKNLGRERTVHWGQRTIDIDILFYDDLVIDQPDLSVPHPRLHERRFVLAPMAEIAPQLVHPTLHKTTSGLLEGNPDTLEVKNIGPLTL